MVYFIFNSLTGTEWSSPLVLHFVPQWQAPESHWTHGCDSQYPRPSLRLLGDCKYFEKQHEELSTNLKVDSRCSSTLAGGWMSEKRGLLPATIAMLITPPDSVAIRFLGCPWLRIICEKAYGPSSFEMECTWTLAKLLAG